jgi:hypothetical protein
LPNSVTHSPDRTQPGTPFLTSTIPGLHSALECRNLISSNSFAHRLGIGNSALRLVPGPVGLKLELRHCAKNHQSNWTCSKEPVDGSEVCESSKSRQHQHMPFREAVEQDLKSKPCIQQLRIEIEPKLQSKSVDVNERQLTEH